jgi:single stranded DNA-binding protein
VPLLNDKELFSKYEKYLMSASLNKVFIIGNVAQKPEIRVTSNGNPITLLGIVTNRKFTTPAGEGKKETELFRVVTWGRLVKQCSQYLDKNRLVYAEGRLHTYVW